MKDQVGELLKNKEFVRWVKKPDEHTDRYWQKWLDAHPDKREDFFAAREMVLGIQITRNELPDLEKEKILLEIFRKESQPTDKEKNKQAYTLSPWGNHFAFGAKVAAVFLLGFFLFLGLPQPPFSPKESTKEEAPITTIQKQTLRGQKSKFKLPDGTLVWLNSDSKLEFTSNFSDSLRKVHLIGEAYFDVAKDPERPFQVITGSLSTTALGTAFNINTFHKDRLNVALVHGKVKVENKDTQEKILLSPGQRLQYIKTKQKTLVDEFEGDWVTGWKDGILHFKEAPYLEVIEELERWYGVNIQTTGSPTQSWNLTGRYNNESLKMVLDRMSYVERFEYEINEKKIRIKF
ncbi:ferric-dicitrate binding protein FerR (iron transport regulator) [Algoriphagus sp. 4150]|uniref:FecR family protein n=1 Tax=Algoriphagus sp. 4150 TaxID=2817756 RepID=UPI002860B31B|nr:FecR domain-containing protein [Algoriphagus sp. 4150]MDR7127819.1 ferric-dicitrate binding protein FerR (iron transport regulator) [Algoriphagus sp. 4150]